MIEAIQELKQSLANAGRRLARGNRQGYGRDMLELLRQVERSILRRRLSQQGSSERGDTEDVLVEELAEIRARLRRLEDLLESLDDETVGRPSGAAPVRPVHLDKGEALGADRYLSPLNGFYPLEVDPEGNAFRWTGPTHEFLFDLAVDRTQTARFELCLQAGVKADQCEGIALIADGVHTPVEVLTESAGYIVRFELPVGQTGDITTLVFVAPRVYRPADLDGGTDWRMLGVCFKHLKLLD